MKHIPTLSQYRKWSLPSKLTAIGTLAGLISLLFAIVTFFTTQLTLSKTEEISKVIEKQIQEKSMVLGNFTSSLENKIVEIKYFNSGIKVYINNKLIKSIRSGQENKFAGKCHDVNSNLDHLIFSVFPGGAGGIHQITILYYSREDGEFLIEEFASEGNEYIKNNFIKRVDGQYICTWDKMKKDKSTIDIYNSLRPSPSQTLVEKLFSDPRSTSSPLPTKLISHDFLINILKSEKVNFERSYTNKKSKETLEEITGLKKEDDNDRPISSYVLKNTSNWIVISIFEHGNNYNAFSDNIWNAWGVLLARNKEENYWVSFYNIPQGKTSKEDLYRPKIIPTKLLNKKHTDNFISENPVASYSSMLGIEFCYDCSWWGKYKPYLVDLNTMTISEAKLE